MLLRRADTNKTAIQSGKNVHSGDTSVKARLQNLNNTAPNPMTNEFWEAFHAMLDSEVKENCLYHCRKRCIKKCQNQETDQRSPYTLLKCVNHLLIVKQHFYVAQNYELVILECIYCKFRTVRFSTLAIEMQPQCKDENRTTL